MRTEMAFLTRARTGTKKMKISDWWGPIGDRLSAPDLIISTSLALHIANVTLGPRSRLIYQINSYFEIWNSDFVIFKKWELEIDDCRQAEKIAIQKFRKPSCFRCYRILTWKIGFKY